MTHCDIARLEEGKEHLVRFFPNRDVHRKPDDTMHDRAPFRRLLDRVRQWYEKIPARRKEFKPALCTSESETASNTTDIRPPAIFSTSARKLDMDGLGQGRAL